MEDTTEDVHKFIKSYVNNRNVDSSNLTSLLRPLSSQVEILSRHGGSNFIKNLGPEEVYNYSQLILDIVKLSSVKEIEDERQVLVPPLIQPNISFLENMPNILGEDATEIIPLIQGVREDVNHPLRAVQSTHIPHSTPLPDNEAIFLQQSTPLRSGSFSKPNAIADQGSTRFSTIPRRERVRVSTLPAIRDDEPEQNAVNLSPGPTIAFQVLDFARRSQQQIEQRRLFDEPLTQACIPELTSDIGLSEEMEQIFLEQRRERTERRQQQSRNMLPLAVTKVRRLPRLTIKVAKHVQDYEDYLYIESKTLRRIHIFLNIARKEAEIPENVQYSLSESNDKMRAGESHAVLPSLQSSHHQQEAQISGDSNLIPIIPETRSDSVGFPSIHSLQPEPILVPEFVERLIDTGPIIEPTEIRAKRGLEQVIYAGQSTEPRRRKRQKGRKIILQPEVEQMPTLHSGHIPGAPTAMVPAHTPLEILPLLDTERPREGDAFELENQNIFKNKFQAWQQALRVKAMTNAYFHINPLIEMQNLEPLCKESHNVLSTIKTASHFAINSIIPPEINKIRAVQRIAVLLELNTRSLVELKRSETSYVTGVENLTYHATKSKTPKESGFSEGASAMDTDTQITCSEFGKI